MLSKKKCVIPIKITFLSTKYVLSFGCMKNEKCVRGLAFECKCACERITKLVHAHCVFVPMYALI